MGKTGKIVLPIVIVAGAVVGLAVMSGMRAPAEKKAPEETALTVEVVPVEVRSLNFTVSSQGTVQPRTRTVLVAEVAGKIEWVAPELIAGGFVTRGEPLLRIDPSDYEVAVKRAEAELAARRAQLAQERARAEQAVKDWEKLEGRRGDVAPDLVLRKPQLAEAEAGVKAAEADLDKARRDLERTVIGVPYDALVKSKMADLGQYVAPGTQLGETYAVDVAEVRLPLASADLRFLSLPGFPVASGAAERPAVTLSGEVGGRVHAWSAEIVRTEGVVDEKTRVVHAVAQIRDPYGVYAPSETPPLPLGTFVKAEITGHWQDDLVVLPRYALKAENRVLVAGTDDRLQIRRVEALRADHEFVYIGAGLEPGERVITTAIDIAIPGARLRIGAEVGATAGTPEGPATEDGEPIARAGDAER